VLRSPRGDGGLGRGGNDRQQQRGGVRGVVQDCLVARLVGAAGGGEVAGVGVGVELWEVAGGDFEADPVTGPELVAGGADVDRVPVGLAGDDRGGSGGGVAVAGSLDAVVEVDRAAVGGTTTSFAVKSVSGALEAAQSLTPMGPVTSLSCGSGAVV